MYVSIHVYIYLNNTYLFYMRRTTQRHCFKHSWELNASETFEIKGYPRGRGAGGRDRAANPRGAAGPFGFKCLQGLRAEVMGSYWFQNCLRDFNSLLSDGCCKEGKLYLVASPMPHASLWNIWRPFEAIGSEFVGVSLQMKCRDHSLLARVWYFEQYFWSLRASICLGS